jgi:enamine deaminase RidA (YjgF/YER057c/UK114 family)
MTEIARYGSGGPFEDRIGYSRVVRSGSVVVTAGCTSVVNGVVQCEGDPHGQALVALRTAVAALETAGCARESCLQSRLYVTDRSYADAVGRAHHEVLGDVRPAATMVVVAGLIDERMLVEVELVGAAW